MTTTTPLLNVTPMPTTPAEKRLAASAARQDAAAAKRIRKGYAPGASAYSRANFNGSMRRYSSP